MNVGQLKRRLADLPDSAELLLTTHHGHDGLFSIHETKRGRWTIRERIWGDPYQTREVQNAYPANDDRYGGPVLLIEVGELSP